MAISADRQDEPHMRILSEIEELNREGTNPSFNDLSENLSFVKTQLEGSIAELLEKGYIEELSTLWRGMYSRIGYKITQKGNQALELYISKVKHFLSTLMKAYDDYSKDELYRLVMENKDFLWFGYYKGLITKSEIESISKKLDLNVERLWWHNFDGLSGGPWLPPFGG